jgi:hypothetical protein
MEIEKFNPIFLLDLVIISGKVEQRVLDCADRLRSMEEVDNYFNKLKSSN